MRKDESGVSSWCKHTSNELGTSGGRANRRYINRRVRINVKRAIQKELNEGDNKNGR